MTLSENNYYCVVKFNDSMWVEELVTIATMNVCNMYIARFPCRSCKIPAANLVRLLYGSCMQDCVLFISCMAPRLARLLQGLVRLWPLLLQYARFLSKYIRFSCKMCQILMQASLQASCKSLMYGIWCS